MAVIQNKRQIISIITLYKEDPLKHKWILMPTSLIPVQNRVYNYPAIHSTDINLGPFVFMILAFGVELWTKQVILFSMKYRFMPPIYVGVHYLDIYFHVTKCQ